MIFLKRSHPIHPVLPNTHVWCIFEVLVSVDKSNAKPAPEGRSGHLWSEKTCSRFFRNERTRFTPFDPKLMFGAFSKFQFWSTKLVRNPSPWAVLATNGAKKHAVDFFKTNAPNPLRLTQNSCLVRFRSFGFGRQNSCETRRRGPFWLLVERKNLQLIFSKRTHRIHPV